MVSAGLTADPHMISATITALSRLLFEFHQHLDPSISNDLLSTIVIFLRSHTREVVKSSFGFFKVCLAVLPSDSILPHLPAAVANLMAWGSDHKNHFNVKVRHIMERLVRRYGYDTILRLVDEEHRKVLTNIRKRQQRAKRQKLHAPTEDLLNEENHDTKKIKTPAADAFEAVVYGESGSDLSDDDEGANDAAAMAHKKKAKVGRKERYAAPAFLPDNAEEIGDLADPKYLDTLTGV